ncbi:MAG: threonylcarbamoyl-AMP synthase [Bacteroidales bacterium]|nr:threonylcarbamoyl-AMP synthase [Bacteroidales bacterium]MCF8337616.1 threonylcarbamoyl-AMP synthase [Bacteroidales bacterium]
MTDNEKEKLSKEVENAAEVLLRGETILYPTDTIWGIGCDATRAKAVKKVFDIKMRDESKSLIILIDKAERLEHHTDYYSDVVYDLIQGFDKPTTIIYPGAKNLAKNLIAKDGTVAIRVVNHEFCQKLISRINRPIVSTSANLSGEDAPSILSQIGANIREQVDYIVDWEQDVVRDTKPSTILKLKENGMYEVIRS